MRCAFLLLLAVHTLFCAAGVHRRASKRDNGWVRGSRAGADTVVPVQILFAEDGVGEASAELLALSDPESPSFGKYWSPQSVTSTFALPAKDIGAIVQWVQQSINIAPSAIRLAPCRCRAEFNATVSQLETLLDTEYFVYKHRESGDTALVCDEYNLPDSLLPLIDFIVPTVFPFRGVARQVPPSNLVIDSTEVQLPSSSRGNKHLSTRQQSVDCSQFTTPQCLRERYNIRSRATNHTVHPNATFGIFQPSWMSWIASDMDHFFRYFEPHLAGERPEMQGIAGGYYDPTFWDAIFSLEPNLDFQYAMSLVWPQKVTNIQVGDEYISGNLNTMLAAYDAYYCHHLDPELDPQYPNTLVPDGYQGFDCGTHTPPKVLSISYAWAEADFPEEYLRRQCNEYLKLGLQGVTVLAATGDEGTAGRHSECPDPSSQPEQRPFHISFPASCPWVTAVGGTFKLPPRPSPNETNSNGTSKCQKKPLVKLLPFRETVYNRLPAGHTHNTSSTGGFSSVFSAPFYQQASTRSYVQSQAAHFNKYSLHGLFNPSGRGVPDLSALAGDYLVALNGSFRRIFGTSASTPVVASMLAMVNNERMLVGKGPVGFVNPVLYRHPEVFGDVVDGHNAGCWEGHGFNAARGWDAATGLGALDFERLMELYMRLP